MRRIMCYENLINLHIRVVTLRTTFEYSDTIRLRGGSKETRQDELSLTPKINLELKNYEKDLFPFY